MYLTKLTLDMRSSAGRRDVGDAYEMHRTLAKGFAPCASSDVPRFLWRLEMAMNSLQNPTVLVQSQINGHWDGLKELPNYLLRAPETKKVELASLVHMGNCYRFRLLANPTVSSVGMRTRLFTQDEQACELLRPTGYKNKRRALLLQDEQTAWIERQGSRHGFFVQSLTIPYHHLITRSRKKNPQIYIQSVCFEGVLVVHEIEAFKHALTDGIGPAKSFGCGLLSVAPC
jgi:CRISPR system Cascade subunit CasE